MYLNETIVAISTASGIGAIGIVRISGIEAFDIAKKIFKSNKLIDDLSSNTINYGKIIDNETGKVVDEVLLSKFIMPNSYTCENIIEINCHGGTASLMAIVELILKNGARLAEPGEFTKRAFLNGRIDLSQAEAVIDLINSKTALGTKTAMEQLEGQISYEIKAVRNKIIELIAAGEVMIDYPEYEIDNDEIKIYKEIKELRNKLKGLIYSFDTGKLIREGIKTVIIGKPNVGKSSLLNKMIGIEKAIVTEMPGTTRDIVEEYLNLKGILLKVIDTAGIRDTNNKAEEIGVKKAKAAIKIADLIIIIFDGNETKDEIEEMMISAKDKKTIVLINKIDLLDKEDISKMEKILNGYKNENELLKVSILMDIKIDDLKDIIYNMFIKGDISGNDECIITNIRHKNLITKANESLNDAIYLIENKETIDMVLIDLKQSADFLGQITGETVGEDIIREIFSRFCLGK